MTRTLARMVKLVKAHGCDVDETYAGKMLAASADLFVEAFSDGRFILTYGPVGKGRTITSYGETALCVALCRAYEALGK